MMDFCEEIIAEVQNQFKIDYLRVEDFFDEDMGIHKIAVTDPFRNRRKIYCLDQKVINESWTIPIEAATQLSYQIEKDFRPPKNRN
jgi:hypothetical protein|nr:MAG TPA: hypothetical protein [Caudoviricetes sp.]